MNISSMLFGAFQARKPAFIKPATVFPWTELECFSSNSHKIVILSEALRKSIANRGLYGAESKDLEDEYLVDAVWSLSTMEARLLLNPQRFSPGTELGCFSSKLPQNRHPEQSASPIRHVNRVSARSRRARPERSRRNLEDE
jgi:hypothetical protein